METWILIISMYKTGLTQIEFSTKELCQAAMVELHSTKNDPYDIRGVVCIKKN